jgi:peptidoglycan/LPS O-acetylase OafA/YrhL
MRAVAVMLVVVAHAGLGNVVPGGSGVTMFFSISGFIITYLVLREREETGRFDIRAFYLRRFLKIGPPLALIVFIPTGLYAIAHTIDWHAVFAQLAFFYNWTILNGPNHVVPGSRVVWSLAIEEQFYIAFALLWLTASRRNGGERVIVGAALLAIAWCEITKIILVLDSPIANEVRIYYGSDTRIDGIALGILTAVAYLRWRRDPDWQPRLRAAFASQWALPAALALYVATLVYRDEYFRSTARFPLQSIAACTVILFGFLAAEGPVRRLFDNVVRLRAIQAIGLASYSIYLVHFSLDYLVLSVVYPRPEALRIVLLAAVACAVGGLVYLLVEIPFARLRARLHAALDPGRAMTGAEAAVAAVQPDPEPDAPAQAGPPAASS